MRGSVERLAIEVVALGDSGQGLGNSHVRAQELNLDRPALGERDDRSSMNLVAPVGVRGIGHCDRDRVRGAVVVCSHCQDRRKTARNNGDSTVTSLILSGVFPACGVLLAVVRGRRLDVIGALVLIGIAVGVGLGLATKNARLLLLEGSVPTALFALACLGSLLTARPLMFRFAHEFI